MKKLLLLAGIVALTMSGSAFAAPLSPCPGPCPMPCPEAMSRPCPMFDAERPERPHCDKKKFIEELNLSKKQQEQLEQLKSKEKEAITPLKEQISVKKQEIDAICNERLTVKERQEKLQPVNNEIRELRKDIKLKCIDDLQCLLWKKNKLFQKKAPISVLFNILSWKLCPFLVFGLF